MKKFFAVIVTVLLALGLVACGGGNNSQVNSSKEPVQASIENKTENEYYFSDGVLVSKDIKIEITDWKVIPVGEEGNEYGDTPVIAFWYNITNLSGGENVTPMSWIYTFTAIQDNNPDKVNELDVGLHPDEELADDQMSTIKEGGTLAGAMAYELDDETTPVTLIASGGLMGEELGEQTFDIA